MIKKNEESGKEKTKISNFKKFSELNKGTKVPEEASKPILPLEDSDIPMNPNLPNESSKVKKSSSTRYMKSPVSDIDYTKPEKSTLDEIEEGKIEFYGKVARLPKNVKASKGLNFLENVKISKSSIWYIMVERMENSELQLVKYNQRAGVDINKFINELKNHYVDKYEKNPKLVSLIENICIDGNDKYSSIKNIPLIEVGGKKLISIITEDLIKLLSK